MFWITDTVLLALYLQVLRRSYHRLCRTPLTKCLTSGAEGVPPTRPNLMARSLENLTKRKPTGGRSRPFRGRRAYERDSYAIEPLVGETARRLFRRRGGSVSAGVVFSDVANVSDSKGRAIKSKIIRVKKSPANRDYERRGVITKGAVIETEAGEAVVTSRPTDDGVVNAVLTKSK